MNITVYCGANFGKKSIYKDSAIHLGEWIADNKYNLVYGGGNVGLMGALADSVLKCGGEVIGVIPEFLRQRELAHETISELIVVETMTERKNKMIELGDCYIALPGGTGTLEEIAEVVSWSKLGKNDNPCIFLNIDGYYEHLEKFFDNMVSEHFFGSEYREKILFTDSFDEIDKFINSYVPPEFKAYEKF